jgi:hypothetical protein
VTTRNSWTARKPHQEKPAPVRNYLSRFKANEWKNDKTRPGLFGLLLEQTK